MVNLAGSTEIAGGNCFVQVLQFKTDQQADVKKIVDFVAKLFPLFASGKDAVGKPCLDYGCTPRHNAVAARAYRGSSTSLRCLSYSAYLFPF